MATARDLERFLISAGYSRARLDRGNRTLRDAARLPRAGRGPHAPHLSISEVAAMILGYAAAGSAIRAADRLHKLEALRSPSDDRRLLAALCDLIETPTPFSELLISRIRSRARILFPDGSEAVFAPPTAGSKDDRAENWWSIKPPLLLGVAAVLRGEHVMAADPEETEEDE